MVVFVTENTKVKIAINPRNVVAIAENLEDRTVSIVLTNNLTYIVSDSFKDVFERLTR